MALLDTWVGLEPTLPYTKGPERREYMIEIEKVKDDIALAKAHLLTVQVCLQGSPVLNHLACQVQIALLHLQNAERDLAQH